MKVSRAWMSLAYGALLLMGASQAVANVTLSGQLINPQCSLSTALGVVPVECAWRSDGFFHHEIGFEASIQPGEAAYVTATLHYTYRDDGRPLASQGSFQLDPYGFEFAYTDFEAGALYSRSNLCEHGRACPHEPGLFIAGSGLPPLLLGINDHPDFLSGQVELFSSVYVEPTYAYGPLETPVYVGWSGQIYAGIVPEPSRILLIGAGLVAVAQACRRRPAPPACLPQGMLPTSSA